MRGGASGSKASHRGPSLREQHCLEDQEEMDSQMAHLSAQDGAACADAKVGTTRASKSKARKKATRKANNAITEVSPRAPVITLSRVAWTAQDKGQGKEQSQSQCIQICQRYQ